MQPWEQVCGRKVEEFDAVGYRGPERCKYGVRSQCGRISEGWNADTIWTAETVFTASRWEEETYWNLRPFMVCFNKESGSFLPMSRNFETGS